MTRRSVCRSAEGCEVERNRRRPVSCVHRVELSVRRGYPPGIACPAVCSGLESDEPARLFRKGTVTMIHPRRALSLLAVLVVALATGNASSAQRSGDDKKPSLSLKATPPVGFSPLRVRLVVDVRGGADDYADFYCPAIEWDWGDGTVSGNSEDCDPVPGRQEHDQAALFDRARVPSAWHVPGLLPPEAARPRDRGQQRQRSGTARRARRVWQLTSRSMP